jgi:hypothetical protein
MLRVTRLHTIRILEHDYLNLLFYFKDAMTTGITILSIMTRSIKTLSMISLRTTNNIVTLSINVSQHNDTEHKHQVLLC